MYQIKFCVLVGNSKHINTLIEDVSDLFYCIRIQNNDKSCPKERKSKSHIDIVLKSFGKNIFQTKRYTTKREFF